YANKSGVNQFPNSDLSHLLELRAVHGTCSNHVMVQKVHQFCTVETPHQGLNPVLFACLEQFEAFGNKFPHFSVLLVFQFGHQRSGAGLCSPCQFSKDGD
ncbi:hypothetical protein PFISCL1PPCAC_11772, partial [Pristionchus fissidentatus]